MTKRIELIFLTYIFFIQACGIINKPLESQNQLELIEKIKLPELSDRWAVIVGVSKYKDPNIRDLNYADKDADSFYNSLTKICRFKKEQIKLLLNENATYENIRRNISGWLFKNANKNDKIIIFFSGHGYRDIDNNDDEDDGFDEFLVPFDYQSDDISSAIRDDEFAYWINSLKAENILLVFDSCFSGGTAKAKGIINENITIKGGIKVDNFAKDIFKEVPRVGVSLLGASKADQISFEEPKLKMGIFTYYLIDSMDKKSDMNLDNKITIKELFDNLKPKVLKFSKANYKREQEPILIDTMKNPFDLVYVPIELSGSAGKNKEKIENLLSMANLAKDTNRKIELLEECCKLDPKNGGIHAQLARELFWSKNYDKAIYHYEIAISVASKKKYLVGRFREVLLSSYYRSISEVYEGKGLFEEAKQHIQKAIDILKAKELIKNDFIFYNQLGDLYYKNNELSEAIQTYLYSIQMNEIQDDIYFKLSRIYIKLMKYEEALSILEKAININPDYSEFYYLQGLIYKYIKRDVNRSNELFKRFFDLNVILKSNIKLISLGKGLVELNQTDEHLSEIILGLEEIIKKYDYYADAYIDLIQICNKYKKNLEKANYYNNKLIEIYPFFEIWMDTSKENEIKPEVDFHEIYQHALDCYNEGKFDDAIKYFNKAKTLSHENEYVFFNCALAYHNREKPGDFTYAIDDCSSAIEFARKKESTNINFASVHFNRGNAYFKRGDSGDKLVAIRDYTEAISIVETKKLTDPIIAAIYLNRGHAYVAIKKIENAKKDYKKVCEISPNSYECIDAKKQLSWLEKK